MTAPSGPARTLVRVFTQRFSATRRGARLARQLALVQLHDWGIPERTRVSDDAGLLVAELAANAVVHGLVPGRGFELRMVLLEGVLRIEVSDARRDRRPEVAPHAYQAESGYGLRLVDAVAVGWGVCDRVVGKTVWAELSLRASAGPASSGAASASRRSS
ncbi:MULTISPECIES: ATP-binding protein [unclassified Streptomyces]|uniref:ATP-binding protein n=1 Tax=unclassified Streptomyces TaxID=2593676 RepID=UPI0022570097|nr:MULTISPECIES: ATP-binding protein [unclassified Streptomyces]MCX4526384.1 ATP-binding protein [Streptomyces sp. NBC_01551]MCX4543053.1 ATP-binding protein [Streptomyces sp. NBC_01565]